MRYTPSELERAVDMVITEGKTGRTVSDLTHIPYRTLMGRVREKKRGILVEKKKRYYFNKGFHERLFV